MFGFPPPSEITLTAALADLLERRWEARARAAGALATCEPEDRAVARAALRPLLADERGEVRYAAAYSLGELGDPEAVPALIGLLADRDRKVREAATIALGRIGDRRAFDPLAAALREGPPEVRFQAVDSLAELDLPAALPHLVHALGDGDPEVRANAAAALGAVPADTPGSAGALAALRPLLEDPRPDPRLAAAVALARRGERAAVPALLGFLDDRQRGLEALEALALVPDAQSAAPLRQLLRRILLSPLARARAAYALSRTHPAEGRPILARLAGSRREDVRGLAHELLATLDGAPTPGPAPR